MNTTQQSSSSTEEQWWLPDFIRRHFDIPEVPPVQSSTLGLLNPNHLGRPAPEIRSLLQADGASFYNGLRAILPDGDSIVNLQARTITLTQTPHPSLPFTLPDSAFILEGSGFFPFHALLMAAYCSRIGFDIPPASTIGGTSVSGQMFDVRIIRLPFGNEMVMACFREWVYRQDGNVLRPAILPSSTSLPPFEVLRQNPERRRRLSRDLSSSQSELHLWGFVLQVLDFRRLMTMLGVDDTRIWTSLSLAWEILLDALNLCCIARAAEDEARGLYTSATRETLRRGLGLFDNTPGSQQP